MEDKRGNQRFRLDMPEVNGKLTFANEVSVLNISPDGVSLSADHRLNMGCKYVIKLFDKTKQLALKGVVVWSSLSGVRRKPGCETVLFYTAGMKFVDIPKEKNADLLAFIEANRRKDPPTVSDRRQNARFLIKSRGQAQLNCQTEGGEKADSRISEKVSL